MHALGTNRSSIAGVIVAAIAFVPAAAYASTASSDGTLATYRAAAGEANRVAIDGPGPPLPVGGAVFFVSDPGAVIEAGPGCLSTPDPHTVTCTAASIPLLQRAARFEVEAGDLDDEVEVRAAVLATISGGEGDDRLRTGPLGNVDSVFGGPGDDDLSDAGGGHNHLCGEGGDDVLHGTQEHDHLIGGGGSDVILAGDGTDGLVGAGSGENCRVRPPEPGAAPSPAEADGIDTFFGGGDLDIIQARDGRREPVSCGSDDADRAEVDDQDAVDVDCEVVDFTHRP